MNPLPHYMDDEALAKWLREEQTDEDRKAVREALGPAWPTPLGGPVTVKLRVVAQPSIEELLGLPKWDEPEAPLSEALMEFVFETSLRRAA